MWENTLFHRSTQVNTEGPRTLYRLPKTNLENIFDESHLKKQNTFSIAHSKSRQPGHLRA